MYLQHRYIELCFKKVNFSIDQQNHYTNLNCRFVFKPSRSLPRFTQSCLNGGLIKNIAHTHIITSDFLCKCLTNL